MRFFRGLWAAVVCAAFSNAASAGAITIGEYRSAVLPTPLLAEYTCGVFISNDFRDAFTARWASRYKSSAHPQETLREALTQYESIVRAFCSDVQDLYKDKDAEIDAIFARHNPSFSSDRVGVLGPEALSWMRDEASLLQRAVVLTSVYDAAAQIDPEKLKIDLSHLPTATEMAQVRYLSRCLSCDDERMRLIIVLRNEEFAKVAPTTFDLERFRAEELRSRVLGDQLGSRLPWTGKIPYELTRMTPPIDGIGEVVKRHTAPLHARPRN